MVLSAILVALLATMGQWWFFGPVTKCLVYPLTTGTLVGLFMGDPMTGMLAGANIQLIYLGWIPQVEPCRAIPSSQVSSV